ncbi:biotin-dependent carboxyltransferase family protein [Brevibacillus laterosporus]|uniref:Biotin-dependent carboxyltransferase family protein n=1 Tax=Brevibacillus laterosporus TaxID=1465 RepID=A0AAP3DHN3_BRELA|nr:biotin-dependent carboxyltransferase family protein [Brevibacillus laterosporus]AYB40192.1 biotin-dependent carboxyltransferase family protein [Brevibacillus laterosporus]MBM7107652.1 KipI antagonist [Brevibacillus laterosporus]MCR8980667.1 biotin-dependent carboxyltransferase family protein [Brevibacillus laterosporus]MCZ0807822.1 biotin-dependent carboxyltransferase family protein [Brevibacillus laterosporus]MCZ0826098.1 biotin-dependent carboxyltransferase family protein [Brevibacillus l
MSIRVIKPGLLTLIQDQGRFGFRKYGVVTSEAMDPMALRIANMLVGNAEQLATLEMTLTGAELAFEHDSLIAITGADLSFTINGERLPMWRPIFVRSGTVVKGGGCRTGCRAYLAIAGGIEVEQVLGSRSTYARAGMGGYQGRSLQAGDYISVGEPANVTRAFLEKWDNRLAKQTSLRSWTSVDWSVSADCLATYRRNPQVRISRGTHFSLFTSESQQNLFQSPYKITPQSDRMGYRLQGAMLDLVEPIELLSEAVAFGTIQVPAEGYPIILLADRQTTGGYPRIGQVATVDLPILAQMKPGEEIMFTEIERDESEKLLMEREQFFIELQQGILLQMMR